MWPGEAPWEISAAFAKKEFETAQGRFQSDANNPTNAWQFARAAFDYAEFSTNDTQRAALANQGIAASHTLVVGEPELAAGHYYLAMNLGQLARTEYLGALTLVKEMEPEFKAAGELDPQFDHAGPKRNLGLLYRDAPGWPVSIGNPSKAQSLLKQAVKLAPDFPENYLHLIESYLKWNEPDDAQENFARPRRHLAGGADHPHRREMGTKLGQLVLATRRREKETRRNPGTVKTPPI